MGKLKKTGPARGFGARYGATPRKRWIKIIVEMRKPHKCPNCAHKTLKRISVGIWKCRKCGFTFAGGAYVPMTELGMTAKRISG